MDKPEIIHSQHTPVGTEVLLVKEITHEDGTDYIILATYDRSVLDWNPTPHTLLNKGQGRGEHLTEAQLDALCNWWQARRSVSPSTLTDEERKAISQALGVLMVNQHTSPHGMRARCIDTLRNLLERLGGNT